MIRIITNTTYGYNNGRFIEPKTKDSEPFSVNPEREAELVAAGIAEYVGEPETISETGAVAEETTEAAEAIEAGAIDLTEDYLEGLKMPELKELAGTLGVTYKVGMKKVDLIEAILADAEGETETEDEEPADDVPTFDAADAIV